MNHGIPLLLFSALLMNCASAPSRTEAASLIPLSQVVQQGLDGLEKSPQTDALLERSMKFSSRSCKRGAKMEDDLLCAVLGLPEAPPLQAQTEKLNRKTLQDAKAFLKEKKFDTAPVASLNHWIRAAKGFKAPALISLSQGVLQAASCLPPQMYLGLSSVLEIDFPSEQSFGVANELLQKATACGDDENAKRASFRLAMLKVWKNDCDGAIPLFAPALKSPELNFLHSRSEYWKNRCVSRSKGNSRSTASIQNQYPLSFHALIEPSDIGVFEKIQDNREPGVRFRSEKKPALNQVVTAAEVFLRHGNQEGARKVLRRIDVENVGDVETEFLVYISVLANRAQAGLLNFQLLAKLFSKNPALRTKTSMSLFYPNWYVKEAERHHELLDPYLALALIRQESAFDPKVRSPRGALGLMQLLPGTARQFGVRMAKDLNTPDKNIGAGIRLLAKLVKRYNGKVPLALAAYNAGPQTVDRWIKRYSTDDVILFTDLLPYRETREYVASVLRNWYWYRKLYSADGSDPILQFKVAGQ